MYILSTDADRALITIKIVGMMSAADVERLYRDEYLAIARMGCRVGEHVAMVDLTECSLQLQDVAAAFERQIGSARKARRLAIFTGNSVSRMQARRIMRRDGAALFATQVEAEAWLFDEGGAARAA